MRSLTFPIKSRLYPVCFHLLMLCDCYLANHKWPICDVLPVRDVYSGLHKHLVSPDLFSLAFCRFKIFMSEVLQQFNKAVRLMLILSEHTATHMTPLSSLTFQQTPKNTSSVQVLNYTCDGGTCCAASSSICSICCSALFHRKLFWISSGFESVTWGHGSYRTL